MDITETVIPKSDQLNADDLIAGPTIVTIAAADVRVSDEQPVKLWTTEFGKGRPWRPCKSMRRVLISAWGADASQYVGRRIELYRDESVKFGGQDVGGIRISRLSHIDRPLRLALTATRGKRVPLLIEPLPDDGPPPPAQGLPDDLADRIAASDDSGWLEKSDTYLSKSGADPEKITELRAMIADRLAVLAGAEQ